MIHNANLKYPEYSFIASCKEFKERINFCEQEILPRLKSRRNVRNEFISLDKEKSTLDIETRRCILNIYSELKRRGLLSGLTITEIIKKIIELANIKRTEKLAEFRNIENKLIDLQAINFSNFVILGNNLDKIVDDLNKSMIKVNNLNFSADSIFDNINPSIMKEAQIIINLKFFLESIHRIFKILEEISDNLNSNTKLRSSFIQKIILKLEYCVKEYLNISNSISDLNFYKIISVKIKEFLDNIQTSLINEFSNILKIFCNWGKYDNIVEDIINKKSINMSNMDPEVEKNIDNGKNISLAFALCIILILLSDCEKILRYLEMKQYKYNIDDKITTLSECLYMKIIPYLVLDITSNIKPLFFSKNCPLSNIEKPEWFLQTLLSVFNCHSIFLKRLWSNWEYISCNLDSILNKSENVLLNLNINRLNIFFNEILSMDPIKYFSISFIGELRKFIILYLNKLLFNGKDIVRNPKIDSIFEKFVEQWLIQYRTWYDIHKSTAYLVVYDLITNSRIEYITKESMNLNLIGDMKFSESIDITQSAISWAKSAFSIIMGDAELVDLESFISNSTFPPNYGLLTWLYTINRIYIHTELKFYMDKSLTNSFTNTFSTKRTIEDLYISICSHSKTVNREKIIEWFSEILSSFEYNSTSQFSGSQPFLIPIKSFSKDNKEDFISVLGFSIEVVELLNALAMKSRNLIDAAKQGNLNIKDEIISILCDKIGISINESYFNIVNNKYISPLIELSIIGKFTDYIQSEWNYIGRKISVFTPLVCILIESVEIVKIALQNLEDEWTETYKDSILDHPDNCKKLEFGESKKYECKSCSELLIESDYNEKCSNPTCNQYNSQLKENHNLSISIYQSSLKKIQDLKSYLLKDLQYELNDVLIHPLKDNEIKIPTLEELLNSDSLSITAGVIFDDNLAKIISNLKYAFIFFKKFLSSQNLEYLGNFLIDLNIGSIDNQ
ncbi:uncharacterized protein CMU_032590 [Cryptosporidium muris RN66]|uniref:Uncharacterized protein n=1 Tax=Cryptosporidium muris (strain RN66) TaxID=441375 RepID=B6AF83_CRYMR|nr:uncharacterized protein CMU_032590 [Cryptosporidium muris RN66]EEA06874.1 hypothetical protein, conserved [Cryptosporidium muris RN66]|eukprot:XP_002141223.1 hypothetical protein [Cryptosporidium muris RN66]